MVAGVPKIPSPSSGDGGATVVSGVYPTQFPQLPKPLKGEGLISTEGEIIPHGGTLINQITINTAFATAASGDIVGRLTGSTVWTVNATDVNAGADGFMGVLCHWYDDVNDRLYVFALDTGTTPDTLYTAYITLETGSVTNVGNVQLGTDMDGSSVLGDISISRVEIDSGNFTFKSKLRTLVINSTTGAEVSNVSSVNTTDSNSPGPYTTLDGLISVGPIQTSNASNSFVKITRGGNTVFVATIVPFISDDEANVCNAIAWGTRVKIAEAGTTGGVRMLRTFLRTEFDAWCALMADYGGLA